MRYVIVVLVTLSASLTAQDPSREPRFEVISIKAVTSALRGSAPQAPDLFSLPFTTALQLVSVAYGLPSYRVIGGPAWLTSVHFQVLAKSPSPIPRGQKGVMVRGLLAERFGFSGHTESRELPTYDLVMARSDRRFGPNLKPAPVDCTPFLTGERPASEGPAIEVGGRSMPRCDTVLSFGNGFMSPLLMGRTMGQLASYLSGQTLRDVIDKTGLSGVFDMELTFAPETAMPGLGQMARREAPALFTALQEQLGLKLQPSTTTSQVLVIDHIERPSEN